MVSIYKKLLCFHVILETKSHFKMLHYACLVYTFYMCVVMYNLCEADVLIKESVVNPFTILISKQTALMEKLNNIEKKMQVMQGEITQFSTDSRDNSFALKESEQNDGMALLEEKINKLSSIIDSLGHKESNSTSTASHIAEQVAEKCYSRMNTIKQDVLDIVTKKLAATSTDETNHATIIKNNQTTQNSTMHNDTSHQSQQNDLFKILNIIQRIEYRQQVERIARDRSMDIILRKLFLHQKVSEERIFKTILEETRVLKEHLNTEGEAMTEFVNHQQRFSNAILDIAASIIAKKDYKQTGDGGPGKDEKLDNWDINDSSFDSYNDINQSVVPLSTDPETTLNESNSIYTFGDVLERVKTLFKISDRTISHSSSEDSFSNTIQEDPLHRPMSCNCTSSQIEKLDQEAINREEYGKIFKMQLKILEKLILKTSRKTDDKLTGLRISRDSALYLHSIEMRSEMKKLEDGITDAIRSIGKKISTKIELTRRALFMFIDAAVTSVSSAAVTSAQTSGLRVAKTLKDVLKSVFQQPLVWNGSPTCPGMYQKLGNTCILILDTILSPWKKSCDICSTLGGEIATITEEKREILMMMLDPETPGFWIQIPALHGVLDDDVILNTLDSDTVKDGEEKGGSGGRCDVLIDGGRKFVEEDCSSHFGVICQYGRGELEDISNNISRVFADFDSFMKNSSNFIPVY